MDRMLTFFGVERDRDEVPHDVFPTGLAPFIRRTEGGSGNKVVSDGAFGLLPFFAKEIAYGRKTYNARSETVAKLSSFRDAWRRGQRCIIPAESIFEPNWETGKAVRWRISQHGDVPHVGNKLGSVASVDYLTLCIEQAPHLRRLSPSGTHKIGVVCVGDSFSGLVFFQRSSKPAADDQPNIACETSNSSNCERSSKRSISLRKVLRNRRKDGQHDRANNQHRQRSASTSKAREVRIPTSVCFNLHC
jgi:hypothetical protein